VNSNTKPAESARTTAELIDAIEARGREITDALAELRRFTSTFG
jgi:hypothetical protein